MALITTWYLETASPTDLRSRRSERAELAYLRIDPPWPELNRFFYTAIGGEWYWVDRLDWTRERWREWLASERVETWMLAVGGLPAGYAELEVQPAAAGATDVEIAYLGLLGRFAGSGLGAHLLTVTLERCWQQATRRVWVHTCSLDHPAALANYQARGMRLVREETAERDLPAVPPGPWPGA